MMIYFKYGFTNYIKTAYETEPPENENKIPPQIVVNYYSKNINENSNYLDSKVIAICGKIASGKTYYANKLKENINAVVLNTDELTYAMFENQQGEKYDELANKANEYLLKKATEVVKAGSNVILDWGFWTAYNRKYTTEYFRNKNVKIEWHYIDIDDISWEENIKERNNKIEKGINTTDFYVTEGLKKKLLENWEEPDRKEIDVWYSFVRNK